METCPIGIVPFGTGNDFARVLGECEDCRSYMLIWITTFIGWGGGVSSGNLLGENMSIFKERILQWIYSIIEEFDIWDVKVEMHNNGMMRRIEKITATNGSTSLGKSVVKTHENGKDIPITVFRK